MNVIKKLKEKITEHTSSKSTELGEEKTVMNGDKKARKSSHVRSDESTPRSVMATPNDPSGGLRPTVDDTVDSIEYRDYQSRIKNLIHEEQALAWDEPAKQSASETEKRANRILIQIRENERIDTLFGNIPGEALPEAHTRDMGGRFLTNKDRINQSKVFDIASNMPKGAHLHVHFNAELFPEKLFPHARELKETMFIRSTKALVTPKDFADAEIMFNVFKRDKWQAANAFSPEYNPGEKIDGKMDYSKSWMRWSDFRQQFPEKLALEAPTPEEEGLDRAERWAREKMVITHRKAYEDGQTTNGVWACFNIGTRAFKGLLNYESVYRWYIGELIDSMARDGIMYTELRPTLLEPFIPSDDGTKELDHAWQMGVIVEEAEKKKAEFPFGLKVIYCTARSIPRTRMRSELANCLKLKKLYPKLICGFDLVGAEDRINHIGFYADLLVNFTEACKKEGLGIPFFFHAGETLIDTGGSFNPNNSNLYDALLLNSRRIGHGYAILKHPLLVEKYKKQNICLELCPISNELLHLCGNARQHIFPELLAAGLHCTLNADNPNLYGNSLSHEFYQVMVGDTRMSIHGWKQLAQWSIEHSCLSEVEKVKARATFQERWEKFCQWVVDTHGPHAEGLTKVTLKQLWFE